MSLSVQTGALYAIDDALRLAVLRRNGARLLCGRVPMVDEVLYLHGADYNVRSLLLELGTGLTAPVTEGRVDRTLAGRSFFIGSVANFWHFLFNHAARMVVADPPDPSTYDAFILNAPIPAKWREILTRLGVPGDRLLAIGDATVACDHLTFAATPVIRHEERQTLFHAPSLIRLRDRLLAGRTPQPDGSRLYLPRGRTGHRRLLNEDAVIDHLCRHHGFTVFDPADVSLDAEIDRLSRASLVVGPYGAGLTSLLFAPAGARVIELAYSENQGVFFRLISHVIGQDFRRVDGVAKPGDLNDTRDFTVTPTDLDPHL